MSKMPIFRVKSVKNYTGQKKIYTRVLVAFVTNMRYVCNCWGYRLWPLGSLPGKLLWKALIFKERSSIDLCLRCCNQPISNVDQDSTFSNWKQIFKLCGGWCYCALLLTGCWLFSLLFLNMRKTCGFRGSSYQLSVSARSLLPISAWELTSPLCIGGITQCTVQ